MDEQPTENTDQGSVSRQAPQLPNQVTELRKLIHDTADLIRKAAGLDDIRVWVSYCKGSTKRLFPAAGELHKEWGNFKLVWIHSVGPDTVDETFFENLSPDEQEFYEPQWQDYQSLCVNTLYYVRHLLLDYVSLATEGASDVKAITEDSPEPKLHIPGLGFIDDSDVKNHCQELLREADASRVTGSYLGGTFLIGAALEGILFGIVKEQEEALREKDKEREKVGQKLLLPKERDNQKKAKAIEKFELNDLIEVVTEVGWITEQVGSKLATNVRDYRNYIHPAKLLSHGVKISDNDFLTSWGSLCKVIEELSASIPVHTSQVTEN